MVLKHVVTAGRHFLPLMGQLLFVYPNVKFLTYFAFANLASRQPPKRGLGG